MTNFKLIDKQYDSNWFLNSFLDGHLHATSSAADIRMYYQEIMNEPSLESLNGSLVPLYLPQWLIDDFKLGCLYDIAKDICAYVEHYQSNAVIISIHQPDSFFDAVEKSMCVEKTLAKVDRKYTPLDAYHGYSAIIEHSIKFDPQKDKSIKNFFSLIDKDYNIIDSILVKYSFSSAKEYFNSIREEILAGDPLTVCSKPKKISFTLEEIFEEKALEIGYNFRNYTFYIVDHLNKKYFILNTIEEILKHYFFKNCSEISRLEQILIDLKEISSACVRLDFTEYQITYNDYLMEGVVASISSKNEVERLDALEELHLKIEIHPSWLVAYEYWKNDCDNLCSSNTKNVAYDYYHLVKIPEDIVDTKCFDTATFKNAFMGLFGDYDDATIEKLYKNFCYGPFLSPSIIKEGVYLPVDLTLEMKDFFKSKISFDSVPSLYRSFVLRFGCYYIKKEIL